MTGAQNKQATALHAGDLGPLMELIPVGYPDVLQEIALAIFESLVFQEPDYSRERFAAFAVNAADRISREFGGGNLYIPNRCVFFMRQKYAEIKRDFRGDNYRALSRKHGVSESRIRQIVNETR